MLGFKYGYEDDNPAPNSLKTTLVFYHLIFYFLNQYCS